MYWELVYLQVKISGFCHSIALQKLVTQKHLTLCKTSKYSLEHCLHNIFLTKLLPLCWLLFFLSENNVNISHSAACRKWHIQRWRWNTDILPSHSLSLSLSLSPCLLPWQDVQSHAVHLVMRLLHIQYMSGVNDLFPSAITYSRDAYSGPSHGKWKHQLQQPLPVQSDVRTVRTFNPLHSALTNQLTKQATKSKHVLLRWAASFSHRSPNGC